MTKTYAPLTYATIRNVNLMQGGTLDGISFVRCIPRASHYNEFGMGWDLPAAERLKIAAAVVADLGEEGVCISNNPDFGGDYVRVNRDSKAFRLICHLKS